MSTSDEPAAGEQKPPKIEFPCQYPLKVIADARESLIAELIQVLRHELPDLKASDFDIKDSRNQRFVSLRFTIEARSETHVADIFNAIKTLKNIHMVL
ncbi:YbeD family protein [Allohahella sp. A8]|uniref:HP0495 family protein n=1 Tax=Allohahella sp. A8 TaxID=3141461 RepID=UPI000C0970ED|nr:hypothetical protein [Hahellaceae bacterium]